MLFLYAMANQKRIWLVVWVVFVLMISPMVGRAQQQTLDVNKVQLASRYFQTKDFDKAAILYKELYESTESQTYFELYISCLIGISDFETAEDEIKRAIRRRNNDAKLYVQWAYLLKEQDREEEYREMMGKAIETVKSTRTEYVSLANAMISRGEYEFAEILYQEGRKRLPQENFYYEMGRVYLYQRNYEKMFEEYLLLIREDETRLINMQSTVQSAFRADVDNSLHEYLRVLLLKRIQEEPDVLVYNRMLIWYFLQEKNFASALRQQVALDRRTGNEDLQIIELARIAGRNGEYKDADNAYDYMIAKGSDNEFFVDSHQERMHLAYQQFTETKTEEREPQLINDQFERTISLIGLSADTYQLLIDNAHFLAFYFGQANKAITLLTDGMALPNLTKIETDEIKTELADVNVFGGDMYEAILLYSQVIESNKTNDLGDEVKLKKARLGYYMGELDWAKAQLDVIKASTSKLVANDAMQLSMFIGNNASSDTTQVPLQKFARADLHSFRNEKEQAWAILDSIEAETPYTSLLDDIYYRKANVLVAEGEYLAAAEYLQEIITNYAYDLLGDDALFLLAGIYERQLHEQAKAEELYKNMLLNYPGSVYVPESRERYREMKGESEVESESEFLNDRNTN